jgi:hypothetical protein
MSESDSESDSSDSESESDDDEPEDDSSDSDSDSESESDDDEPEHEGDNYFLKNMIYKDSHKTLFKTDAREFVPEMKIFQQRKISQEHVKNLEKEVLISNHFKGNIKILRDPDNNYKLIDGIHRYYALKNIMEKDSKFNIKLILEIYETDFL